MRNLRRQHRNARSLFLEQLERRQLLAGDFTNPANPLDVNDDGNVSPIDVVMVMNRLNRAATGQLPTQGGANPPAYYDVNCNGQVEPNDLLRIVNSLNGGPMVGSVFVFPPTMGVQGQPISFTFSTQLLEQVDFAIDWDGNGSVDQNVRGDGARLTVEHAFSRSGEHKVRVTAETKRPGAAFTASAATEVMIDVVEMQGGKALLHRDSRAQTLPPYSPIRLRNNYQAFPSRSSC